MEIQTYQLPNKIRLIHHPTQSKIAYLGVIINAGSRDESPDQHGLAHFIEHMLFKGTKKRKAFHINTGLERAGGELNAYTTKEQTAVFATFLQEDYKKAIDIISDIVFHSTFPEKEIKKEQEVILDEINSYKDTPSELIFDDFEALIFDKQPIGRGILGTEQTVNSFKSSDMNEFINKHYNTDEIIISSIGKIKFPKLIKLIELYFGNIPENKKKSTRTTSYQYTPKTVTLEKQTFQTHCLIGNMAYHINHEDKNGLLLLNNILGGPSSNSRLNLLLREKNGYTYHVDSSYAPYGDTGVFGIYFGTDKKNLKKCLQLTKKEMQNLRTRRLGTLQLSQAKKQLIGQLAISRENGENLMLAMGSNYLIFNRFPTIHEISKKIELISSGDLLRIANEILNQDQLSTIIYQ